MKDRFKVIEPVRGVGTCYMCGNSKYLYPMNIKKSRTGEKYDFFKRKRKIRPNDPREWKTMPQKKFKVCADCIQVRE